MGNRIGPHRRRALEREAFDRTIPVRVDRVPRPAVGRQREHEPLVLHGLIDLGANEGTSEGRFQRGDEKPVIPPRQGAGHRPRDEPADAVGAEPLPPFGRREVAADRSSPVDDHARPPFASWTPQLTVPIRALQIGANRSCCARVPTTR